MPNTKKKSTIESFFKKENEAILKKLDAFGMSLVKLRYEGQSAQNENFRELKNLFDGFSEELCGHLSREEEVVFPFCLSHVPRHQQIINLLRSEYMNVRRGVRSLRFLLWIFPKRGLAKEKGIVLREIWDAGQYLVFLIQDRFRIKQQALYEPICAELKTDECSALKRQMQGWEKKSCGACLL